MFNFKMLLRPEVRSLIAKKLGTSLALSAMIILPGISLTLAGYRLPGMAWTFTGSFLLMARSYRNPWRWNPVVAFVPPVVVTLSLLFQILVIGRHFPPPIWFIVAALAGLVFGWQRGNSHRMVFEGNRLMVDRTLSYLLLWALSYFLTSFVSFVGQMWMVAPAILTGTFSTAMLTTVALALYGKARRIEGENRASRAGGRQPMAGVTSALLIGLAMALSMSFGKAVCAAPLPGTWVQDDSTAAMATIGRESVETAAGFCKGLIEQKGQEYPLSAGNGTTIRIDADFDVQLDGYVTDTHSRIEITKFNDAQAAKSQAEAQCVPLKRLSSADKFKNLNMLPLSGVRGELSLQSPYAPQTGGQGHRALIQQGQWLIDVDTVAWDPGDKKNREIMAVNQSEITYTIAAEVFDKGVAAGLISLEPTPAPPTSVPETGPTNSTPNVPSTIPATPEVVDIENFVDKVPMEELIDPVDVEVLTALIALVLIAGGMTVDAATAIATAIAEGMIEGTGSAVNENDASDRELDEIDVMADSIEAEELGEEKPEQSPVSELSDEERARRRQAAQQQIRDNEGKGTTRILGRDGILMDGMRGSGNDVLEAGRELADLVPVVGETLAETIRDVNAFHPSSIDLARMSGVHDDLLSAGRGLHNALAGLSQLAGDQFANRIEQDQEVLAALELLAIVSRIQSVPGAALIDGSAEQLQRLLTERKGEVMAGLYKIGQLAGNATWFAVRNAVGAQEWENAVNGDLSPLTRIANALLGSAQAAGVLHSAGTSIAGRLAGAGDSIADVAHAADATESLMNAQRGADAAETFVDGERAADAANTLADATHLDDGVPTGRVPGYMDEMADGSRPRQQWPGGQSRRNPETGAIEWRTRPDEPFKPLPEDVADAMRNKPIGKGGSRLNPDSGDIEWRNPETGAIERAPEQMQRRPGYEQSSVPTATGRDAGLRNLPEGSVIPNELLPQTGYAPQSLDELARVAKDENIVFGGRTTNMDSLRHIADKTGTPKPVYIKSKTIQDLDVYLGADPNDVGLVGYFDPGELNLSKVPLDKQAAVELRHYERLKEFNELKDDIGKLVGNKTVVAENGKLYRLLDDGKKIPFAGDIDPAYIRDANTGRVLTGDRYLEVLEKLKKSGAEIQHGSEFNMSADLLRNSVPGTPEYEKAVQKMVELHQKLESAHTSGKEIVVEMWPDGKLRRGAQLRGLGMEN